jgi:putative nucleotidyltransferase-like protein
MQDADIPVILLKGPSIARWLYPSGGRTYVDTDLLVPAGELNRAEEALRSLGFTGLLEGFHPFELRAEPAVETAFSRRPELGLGPGGTVDLHRNLPMLRAPDEFVWEALSAETETFPIGDVEIRVLGRTALALHVVIHAVHHQFQLHTDEDLRRAITVMSVDDWRSVADLATRLGAAEILGFGLRHHAAGAVAADGLGLPSLSLTSSQLGMRFAPRGSASLVEFWPALTLRAKVQRIRWTLLPSPAKMRYVSRLPDAHGHTLLLAYARWWRELAPALVSAVRFVGGRRRLANGGGDGR